MDLLDQTCKDIATFADPYTEVKCRAKGDVTSLEILRSGRLLKLELKEGAQRIVEVGGRRRVFSTLESLLASEQFASLAQLADTQLRAAESKAVKKPIPASICVDGRSVSVGEIVNGFRQQSDQKIQLLLLNGPAGIGKTFQVEQLVVHQANRVRAGEPTPPILHVTSKGRRLSNLKDVLAAATQELNAAFFAKHVPLLVRKGLLIVAVDGFDELVDADGYEDSWLALRQFLADVGTSGAMLLAARDTFVEEQELLGRIERTKQDIELKIGEVLPPKPLQAREWLATSPTWKAAELNSDVADDFLRDGSYALRPFFLRELWSAKGWSDVVDTGPRTYLVNRLLERESKLIAQQVGGTTGEKVITALSALLQEVAMEMAIREVDAIELDHLSFLTQFSFDGIVDDNAIRKLMHKSGSLALLELSEDKGSRRFPHSEIRHYFLGLNILKSLAGNSVPAFLRRHQVNCEELDVFAEIFSNESTNSTTAASYCSSLLSSEVSSDSLAPNLASILIVMLGLGRVGRVDFADVVEATFAGESPVGILSASHISRLDACGSDLSRLEFQSVDVGTLVVDETTLTGFSFPQINALEIRTGTQAQVLRGKDEIEAWLKARSRGEGGDTESPSVRFLEKVARRAVRNFYLRETGDEDAGSALLSDPLWERVSKILSKHSRLDVHRAKSMHGRPSPLIRIKNPMKLLQASDKETSKIIAELVALDAASARNAN